ncbi:aspartyl protease family protein [Caulobacter segnis]
MDGRFERTPSRTDRFDGGRGACARRCGGSDAAGCHPFRLRILLRYLDDAKRLTVKALINGQGPFAFLVDTGANSSVIASELAAQLGPSQRRSDQDARHRRRSERRNGSG